METVWNALAAVVALLAAAGAVGLVVVAGPADPAAIGMLALCAGFFGASAIPAVRAHHSYNLLNAGHVAALFALWFLVVRSSPGIAPATADAIGVFAALAAGGLLVELYNYRHGTSYLRLE